MMAKKKEQRAESREQTAKAARGVVEAVRAPKAAAGPCPKVPHHTNTRVYRTNGQVRYCVCDDCSDQTTWKVTAEYADLDRQWLAELADSLAGAVTTASQDGPVVVLTAALRDQLVERLRTIARG